MKKFFEWLGKANSEDNGNPSNIRFNITYAVMILIPCIAFVLVWVAIKYEDLITVVLTVILGFLTSLFGIKNLQKGKEQNIEPKNEN